MDNQRDFTNLSFSRKLGHMHPRLIAFITTVLVFIILWWIIPARGLLILMLFITPILVWVASYGWRTALNQVIRYLQRFQIN